MLVVEIVARIRREFFVKGKSIKEIVRDLGVSRNTVRKVLRSGETAFAHERSVQPLWSDDRHGEPVRHARHRARKCRSTNWRHRDPQADRPPLRYACRPSLVTPQFPHACRARICQTRAPSVWHATLA
jgi:hypothetical protein